VTEPDLPADPWERYGWVMSVIWLVFLAFPLQEALTLDEPWGWRVLGVGLVLAFAAVYVVAFVRLDTFFGPEGRQGQAWLIVGVLVVLAAAAALVVGTEASSMAPFVVAFAMFALPLRAGIAVLAFTVVALAVTVAVADSDAWFIIVIVLLVGAITGTVRVLEERGEEHRRLRQDLEMVAERERVARDVHDVLGHSLTVVTVKAELAERLVDDDPERAKAELAEIQSLTRQSLAEIRATVGGLRVARLADEIAASRAALQAAGIEADVPDDPSVVDPRHRIVLAWALREAVTNVVRHSAATSCTVELEPAALTVSDDGRGLDGHGEGNGLRGLRERVTAAGGSVDLDPGPDGGTTLRVRL
jgi:two-component system, NarL family, sensor histidine kinase DesK